MPHSLAEYSVLYDLIDEGRLGPHVKEAMAGVRAASNLPAPSGTDKTASAHGTVPEQDARQARIDQLLRRH